VTGRVVAVRGAAPRSTDKMERVASTLETLITRWRADPGTYQVLVGRSADQTELTGTVTLAK